jgi:hypothetical protein
MLLSADSGPSYTAKTTQQLLAGFWIPVDWLLYLPDVTSLDFSICSSLQAKVQAMHHANLPSFICPSPLNGTGSHPYESANLPLILPLP